MIKSLCLHRLFIKIDPYSPRQIHTRIKFWLFFPQQNGLASDPIFIDSPATLEAKKAQSSYDNFYRHRHHLPEPIIN